MVNKLKVINFLQDFGCARLGQLQILYRKFDSFNSLNVTKVLQTLYFFVKFLFFSCTMSHNVV